MKPVNGPIDRGTLRPRHASHRHVQDLPARQCKCRIETQMLRHIDDHAVCLLRRLAEHFHRTRRGHKTENAAQQCRLATAIWPDDHGNLTRFEDKRDLLKCWLSGTFKLYGKTF